MQGQGLDMTPDHVKHPAVGHYHHVLIGKLLCHTLQGREHAVVKHLGTFSTCDGIVGIKVEPALPILWE